MEKMENQGYTSSTFDKDVGRFYAGKERTVLVIDCLKRTKGVYIRQHSKHPNHADGFYLKILN